MQTPPSANEAAEREAAIQQLHRRNRFNLIVGGFAFFEVMYSAARLGLFTFLARNPDSSREQIAGALDLAPYPLRVLLLACTSLGLVKKDGELYRNEPESSILDQNHPDNILPFLEGYHSILYKPTSRLYDSLKASRNVGLDEVPGEGKSLYEKLENLPEQDRIFHDWMSAIGRLAGLNELSLPALDPTLEAVRHLVDYGGGDGANAVKLCQRYPRLKVTVFDLPKVCEMGRANVQAQGLSDRISFMPGDFLSDEMLPNVDAILFSHIFNIYSPENNRKLVERSHRALRPGGKLIIFNSVSNDNEDGPLGSALLSLYFLTLATGQGMVYTLNDYDPWFRAVGFKKVTKVVFPAPNNHAFVIGVK